MQSKTYTLNEKICFIHEHKTISGAMSIAIYLFYRKGLENLYNKTRYLIMRIALTDYNSFFFFPALGVTKKYAILLF